MSYGLPLARRATPTRLRQKLVCEARKLAAPASTRLTSLRGRTFGAFGETHTYFIHAFNTTWRNERCVELPLALDFIARQSGRGLEFGNVLGHYDLAPADLQVVDLYEKAPGVQNVDIVEFRPNERFDYIVAISTLEHVGWDEPERDRDKVRRAYRHLRSLLAPGGSLFITAPLGHNPVLDDLVINQRDPVVRQTTLVRNGIEWIESPVLHWAPYDPRHGAMSVWIAELAGAADDLPDD